MVLDELCVEARCRLCIDRCNGVRIHDDSFRSVNILPGLVHAICEIIGRSVSRLREEFMSARNLAGCGISVAVCGILCLSSGGAQAAGGETAITIYSSAQPGAVPAKAKPGRCISR